jgi:hypothetical protein
MSGEAGGGRTGAVQELGVVEVAGLGPASLDQRRSVARSTAIRVTDAG